MVAGKNTDISESERTLLECGEKELGVRVKRKVGTTPCSVR